ncbi:MAG: hypothetical protein ABIP29_06705 [Candidatus Eisenbacteria bacterium]
MIAHRPGAPVAALTLALAFAVLGSVAARPAAAQLPGWTVIDSTTFEIYQDDRQVGDEQYRAYRSNDTLIIGSSLRMPGLPEGSLLPSLKTTTFLRRADNSWPLVFQVQEAGRDTTKTRSINCSFSDTTVMVFHEVDGVGSGTAVALPPGRLYLLEPGIYAQVQTLVGDFALSTQNKRKQPVLIPSAKAVVDVHLTRGPKERLGQERFVVQTTRIDLTDGLVQLSAWVDGQGRMWKMEAPGQGLRVERAVPANLPAAATGKKKPPATKKGATKG